MDARGDRRFKCLVAEPSSKLIFLVRDKVSFVGAHASGTRRQILFVGAFKLSMLARQIIAVSGPLMLTNTGVFNRGT